LNEKETAGTMQTIPKDANKPGATQKLPIGLAPRLGSSSNTSLLIRRCTKRLTMWAYIEGYLSFYLTQRIFGWCELRDV
jgi:hypothetical protein